MNLARLSLAAALGAASSWAGTDQAFAPILRQVQGNISRYEEAAATAVEIPAPAISLGLSTKTYQCWRLQLTGEHGKRVRELLERVKAAQDSLIELKKRLADGLAAYSPAKPDSLLEQRIISQNDALELLLSSFNELIDAGEKNGLLRRAPKGFFRDRAAVVPVLKNDDYTMVYDGSAPECKSPAPGQ